MMRQVVALILVLAPAGCMATRTRTELDVNLSLVSVQRPPDVAERWGESTLAPADTSGFFYEGRPLSMEDVADLRRISGWTAADTAGVVFEDGLISMAVVSLDLAFFLRIENRTEHSIRFLWDDATLVEPSGHSTRGTGGLWRPPEAVPPHGLVAFFVPGGPFYATCDDVPGTEIRLVIPLESQGVTNEYTLQFAPQRADVVTIEDSMYRDDSEDEFGVDWSLGDYSSVEESRTRCWPTP